MLQRSENRRILNFDSVFIILVVLSGFLFFGNSTGNISPASKKSSAAYISVSEKSAVSSPVIRLEVFQKTWISNKDNFNILAFNRNPLTEDKKTDLKINNLFLKTQEFTGSPGFFLPTHIFPPNAEDPYDLS